MLKGDPKRMDVPHEKGAWFDFRPMSWKKVKEARKALSKEQLGDAKSAGPDLIAAFQGTAEDQRESRKVLRETMKEREYDPASLDTGVVLETGIAAWSYDDEVSLETIEELDERTAVWAKKEIIEITKPPTEEETKNS